MRVNTFKKNKSVQNSESFGYKPEVPKGLLKKCNMCKAAIYNEEVIANRYICPKCHGYFRMHAFRRIESIVEAGTFEQWDVGLTTKNPLGYKGYEEKIAALQEKTKLDEAVITGSAYIGANKVVLAVCDGRFMMASMGQVVGEKITRAVERATKEKLPVIIFACSGGARMQEGIVSLMQMAKTAAALKRHSEEGNLYISVLTDPTTGGVTASFAMLGDIILAEPNARIGFAGPRVIEQTIGQKLPAGFQRSEFLLEHGFIDAIVTREKMKETLTDLLDMHRVREYETTEKRIPTYVPKQNVTGWEKVQLARKKERPVGIDYLNILLTKFYEFHGDRYFSDDHAVVGGIAMFHDMPVTVIAQCKGKGTKENLFRNFGMPSPDGYRKALRLMKQAEKFHRPVICIVDTPGAFCGIDAEERGQGEAIARNLAELSALKTPIFSLVIGEGGSGGALAMAVADEVWLLENAIYSILSPEGYASILWKDSGKAEEAANVMKMKAEDLLELGIVEGIIGEPEHFTTENLPLVTEQLEDVLDNFIVKTKAKSEVELVDSRYERFRKM